MGKFYFLCSWNNQRSLRCPAAGRQNGESHHTCGGKISRPHSLAAGLRRALTLSSVVVLPGRAGVGENRGPKWGARHDFAALGGRGGCAPWLLFLPAVEIKCHWLLSTKRLVFKCKRKSANIPPVPGRALGFRMWRKGLTACRRPQYGLRSGVWSQTCHLPSLSRQPKTPETSRGI